MPEQSSIEAIRTLMATTGVTIEDLTDSHQNSTDITFARHIDEVLKNLNPNTRRTYRTHLLRMREGVSDVCDCTCTTCCAVTDRALVYGDANEPVQAPTQFPAGTHCNSPNCLRDRLTLAALGPRPLREGEFKKTELERFVRITGRLGKKTAHRHNRRRVADRLTPVRTDAHNVQESAILSMRRVFADAIGNGLIKANPAELLRPPKRQETRKRAMNDAELLEFLDTVLSGGNDAELDFLLVWFHLETGARQQGGVGLTLNRVHPHGVIEVFEKGGKYRDQPATPELCAALLAHARERGGPSCDPTSSAYDPESPVFYYGSTKSRPVRPLTSKRYETLFKRIQQTLPFANQVHLTSHQLRKTGAVQVERIAGTQVARKWLGHGARTDVDGYAQASYDEIVEAHRVRFSEPDAGQ